MKKMNLSFSVFGHLKSLFKIQDKKLKLFINLSKLLNMIKWMNSNLKFNTHTRIKMTLYQKNQLKKTICRILIFKNQCLALHSERRDLVLTLLRFTAITLRNFFHIFIQLIKKIRMGLFKQLEI